MSIVIMERGTFDEVDADVDAEIRDAVISFEEQALRILRQIRFCVAQMAEVDPGDVPDDIF